ncbi:unnamed protein product [Discula destructiva]
MFSSRGRRDMRTVWGYTFEWTPEHQTKEQMRPLTYSYDVLASECLDRLDQLSPPPTKPPSGAPETQEGKPEEEKTEPEQSQNEESQDESTQAEATSNNQKPPQQDSPPQPTTTARRDLYALLMHHHHTDPLLATLHAHLHTIPPWVDWPQIARGQAVFYRYGGPAIVALTFQSLVGGMAGARVVETLARTGGFHAAAAKRRLLETFQHVLQVTASLASVQPGGDGFAASVRVRLLHASVRRRILSLAAATKPGAASGACYFDVDAWGVPINDLDCLGTVLSFSAALVWIGLPRQGILLTQQETADYHALWRWVGHLLGTPTEPHLADAHAAKVLFESLLVAELEAPSAAGGVLANNILTALSAQPPVFASRAFMCAEARWLNGGALCDALGIARPGAWYGVLVGAQCLYFMGFCYVKRLVPAWDERNRERVRKILYKMTVENKEFGLGQETIFDFKHVPQIGLTTTPLGDVGGQAKRVVGRSERRSMVTLAVVTALLGSVAWLGLRSALRAMDDWYLVGQT